MIKTRVADCPSCGAPVEFKVSSALVTVCEFCRSVVARGDQKLEDHGKVARLVDTGSPLHVGLDGKYRGKNFEIVGRVQFRHEAGGVWDEWYAAFPGDRWGWISESQGKFHITFPRKLADGGELPTWQDIAAGKQYTFRKVGTLTVAEVGQAKAEGAEGELPFSLRPGERHKYADLSGTDGRFATFDYAQDPPAVFLGEEASLEDLGVADAVREEEDRHTIAALSVSCPNCGGSLELNAPDKTERVACPFCSSLLDCDQGKLQYLKTLEQGPSKPVISIGTAGTLDGVDYTVIGFMRRSVTYDRDYFWSEYLLYSPEAGFRWLVHSDRHWSFGRPLNPGEVGIHASTVRWNNRTFKLFQQANAKVRHVLGEFYWKVEVGETVYARDFIDPPDMISAESSSRKDASGKMTGELNVTRATYLPHEEIERAFGVKGLHRGWKVAPNQPSPVDSKVFLWWLAFGGLLLVLLMIFKLGVAPKVDIGMFWLAQVLVAVVPVGALIYKHSFEKRRWEDSDFSPYSTE